MPQNSAYHGVLYKESCRAKDDPKGPVLEEVRTNGPGRGRKAV